MSTTKTKQGRAVDAVLTYYDECRSMAREYRYAGQGDKAGYWEARAEEAWAARRCLLGLGVLNVDPNA